MTDLNLIPFDLDKLKAGYECVTEVGEGKLINYYESENCKYIYGEIKFKEDYLSNYHSYWFIDSGVECAENTDESCEDGIRIMLKPKTKKLWIAIDKKPDRYWYYTTVAFIDYESLMTKIQHALDDYIIKEIEVEL